MCPRLGDELKTIEVRHLIIHDQTGDLRLLRQELAAALIGLDTNVVYFEEQPG